MICRFSELQVPQTCIYTKKIKKINNFRVYVGLTGIDELVFDFFEYMQVLCTFGIKMLIF